MLSGTTLCLLKYTKITLCVMLNYALMRLFPAAFVKRVLRELKTERILKSSWSKEDERYSMYSTEKLIEGNFSEWLDMRNSQALLMFTENDCFCMDVSVRNAFLDASNIYLICIKRIPISLKRWKWKNKAFTLKSQRFF